MIKELLEGFIIFVNTPSTPFLMTPVYIATKPYIRAWLERAVPGGLISRNNLVGCFLLELLSRDTDQRGKSMSPTYCDRATLYIGNDARVRDGAWLNVTQTLQFNKFVGQIIRSEIRTHILTYLHFDPRVNKAIEYARKQVKLDCDVLADDTIIKDFQRYRDRHGGPRIYTKAAA